MKKDLKKYFAIFVLIVIAVIYGVVFFNTRLEIEDKKDIQVVFGHELKQVPGAKASVFEQAQEPEIQTDLNIHQLGEYKINYAVKLFNILPVRWDSVNVQVVDVTAPFIHVDDEGPIFVKKDTEFVAPAVTVRDDCDPAPLTKISDDIDMNTPGEYKLRIEASDASNNVRKKVIRVIVGDVASEDFDKPFRLKDYFDEGVVLAESDAISENEFSQWYFIGDSNMYNMSMNRYLNPTHVICRYALAPSNFDGDMIWNNSEEVYRTTYELLEEGRVKPQKILLTMGLADVKSGNPEIFISQYEEVLDKLEELVPDCTIVIGSIWPIVKDNYEGLPTQRSINMYNYLIAQMAERRGMQVLDTADTYQDGTGHGIAEYYKEDGFHIKGDYFWVFKDYAKYHLGSVDERE